VWSELDRWQGRAGRGAIASQTRRLRTIHIAGSGATEMLQNGRGEGTGERDRDWGSAMADWPLGGGPGNRRWTVGRRRGRIGA